MEVWVSLVGGKFTILPDPARVSVGTPVTWRFQTNGLTNPLVRWTVSFPTHSPFKSSLKEFTTTTQLSGGQHAGATGAMAPDSPGDYKYDVRVEDARTQTQLGNDDPHLIVTL